MFDRQMKFSDQTRAHYNNPVERSVAALMAAMRKLRDDDLGTAMRSCD
jgi:hypothetical protein